MESIKKECPAIILVGGLGTRLLPLTEKTPKPMVIINGKPFLEYQLENLKRGGIKKVILCIGYLGDQIKNYFQDGKKWGLEINYSQEKELLGTAGAIKNAESLIDSEYFIVLNGDTYSDIDFKDLIAVHENFNNVITMAVSNATNPSEQELVKIVNGRIIQFFKRGTEEHSDEIKKNNFPLINAGTYILDKSILNLIVPDKKTSLEQEIFPLFVGRMKSFKYEGYFKDLANISFCNELEQHIKNELNSKKQVEIKKNILVTGAGGMMGSHILDFLINKGHNVLGIDFVPTTDKRELNKNAQYIECDIRDRDKLTNLLDKFKPELIFHLAAQSFPTVSWDRPEYTVETNILGTINLFEAVKELKLDSIILNAGSSAEYGFVNEDEVPVKETHELKPLHPYGISKVAQELLAYQYYKNFGIKSVTMRIFNTTGPKKIGDVCADFTKQIVLMEKDLQKPVLNVGNIKTKRAITDVRDMIEAFWLAVHKCEYGERYNVSGNKIYEIKEIIEVLRDLTLIKFELKEDPKLLRPTDEKVIFGDSTRFKEKTNWTQKIDIKTTLTDMLDYWRKVL